MTSLMATNVTVSRASLERSVRQVSAFSVFLCVCELKRRNNCAVSVAHNLNRLHVDIFLALSRLPNSYPMETMLIAHK